MLTTKFAIVAMRATVGTKLAMVTMSADQAGHGDDDGNGDDLTRSVAERRFTIKLGKS